MCNRSKRAYRGPAHNAEIIRLYRLESGMSLAEALIALGLLCIFMIPAISMLRQSTVNYSHAYADYQMDLALVSLLAQVKYSVQTHGISDISVNFSEHAENGRYEYQVVIEEFQGSKRSLKYPDTNGLNTESANITHTGSFTGIITAAARDTRTGVIKIKAMLY